ILLSSTIAEILSQLSAWSRSIQPLGIAEVKHGVQIQVFNFFNDEVGNADRPRKLEHATVASAAPVAPTSAPAMKAAAGAGLAPSPAPQPAPAPASPRPAA